MTDPAACPQIDQRRWRLTATLQTVLVSLVVILPASGCAWLAETVMMKLTDDDRSRSERIISEIDQERMIEDLRSAEYVRRLPTSY